MSKPVLVGVDGTTESQLALRWAVDEAEFRGLDLRVVQAYQHPSAPILPPGVDAYVPAEAMDAVRDELDEAIAFARDRLGAGRVSGMVVEGLAARIVLDEAAGAELVAVGAPHHAKVGAAILGSVATAVTAHAPCPVVVVRGERWQDTDGGVIVGVDGSPSSETALTFAFDYAERHEVALRVVHCWHQMHHIDPVYWSEERLAEVRGDLQRWLDDMIAGYQDTHPKVSVETVLVEGRPANELVHMSAAARLVVVGSRGHGGIAGLLLGSVSQGVLHHAHCPVAVVHSA